MSSAQYIQLPTSDHPQATAELTPESTAWFWSARAARSVEVEVISVESEQEEAASVAARMPPTPQDAVFSNIIPARTTEAEELERALVTMGFVLEEHLPSRAQRDAPPQYHVPPAPSYETVEEAVTLASYLFKYGFGEFSLFIWSFPVANLGQLVFPLFWLVGAFIIVSDLHHDSSATPSALESQPSSPTTPKSPYELQLKREEMALLRLAELKWAWRCAYAFAIWFVLVIIALAVVIGTGCIKLF